PTMSFAALPNPQALVGTVIDGGRLRVLAHIGSGGFGAVFRVVELTNNREYALKCMPKAARKTQTYLRQKLEMTVHTELTGHTNVVAFHRWIDEGPWIMFLFDFCAGGDLFKIIIERRCVGNDALLRSVFGQMLDAVAHCHANGVYHRDLKPENFLCTPDLGTIFITDFGLATTEKLTNDFRVGSPAYMSPECLQVDIRVWCPAPQCDVWALGILLFSLLTARVPWLHAVPTDPNFAHYIQWPHLLFSRSAPLPEEIKRLVLDALNVNPYHRISLDEFR
ncbi:kinase-like domain-containing protein, partial [Vararia minispora EC-137]